MTTSARRAWASQSPLTLSPEMLVNILLNLTPRAASES